MKRYFLNRFKRLTRLVSYPKRALLLGLFACSLCCIGSVYSQTSTDQLRIVTREDTQIAHIYHTSLPALGHGFNIYRKSQTDTTYRQINIDPVRGVTSGTELRAYLGTLYDDIEQITNQDTENGTLTKLRSDIRTANLLTFTYPKVAESFGPALYR